MARMEAEAALRYVASRDVVALVGVILVGGLMTTFGTGWMMPWHGRGTGPLLVSALSLLLFVAGVAVQVGGVLALFYKLVHDAAQ